MKYDNLLFDYNKVQIKPQLKIRNSHIYYQNKDSVFNSKSIKNLLNVFTYVNKNYSSIKIPIVLDFGYIKFKDKLTYILLECMINYEINIHKRNVIIQNFYVDTTIWTEGVFSSPFQILLTEKNDRYSKFINKFNKEIYGRHYRRIVMANEWIDSYLNSKIMEQIDWFLKNLYVDENSRKDIAEVISELAGNVHDHTDGDCLIDIDVTEEYIKKDDSIGKYYGLNVVILNFSYDLLGTGIKEKIKNDTLLNDRHKLVKEAYQNHQSFLIINIWKKIFLIYLLFNIKYLEDQKTILLVELD